MKRKPEKLDYDELRNLALSLATMRVMVDDLMSHVAKHPSEDGAAEYAVLGIRERVRRWSEKTRKFK